MNYVKQMNAFYSMLEKGCALSHNARYLWFILMQVCNDNEWRPDCEIHTGKLEHQTGGRSDRLIEMAVKELEDGGYIKVIHRHKKAALYTMVPLYDERTDGRNSFAQDGAERRDERTDGRNSFAPPIHLNGNGETGNPVPLLIDHCARARENDGVFKPPVEGVEKPRARDYGKRTVDVPNHLMEEIDVAWCEATGWDTLSDEMRPAIRTCYNDYLYHRPGRSGKDFLTEIIPALNYCAERDPAKWPPYLIRIFRNKLEETK